MGLVCEDDFFSVELEFERALALGDHFAEGLLGVIAQNLGNRINIYRGISAKCFLELLSLNDDSWFADEQVDDVASFVWVFVEGLSDGHGLLLHVVG